MALPGFPLPLNRMGQDELEQPPNACQSRRISGALWIFYAVRSILHPSGLERVHRAKGHGIMRSDKACVTDHRAGA